MAATRTVLKPISRSAILTRAILQITLVILICTCSAFCDAIHDAARDGDLQKVESLLKGDPTLVSKKDYGGRTPLHWAANAEIAKLLLMDKADANAKGNYGETPLFWAAQDGHADVAKLLLTNNADINAKDNFRQTPLHWAAQGGHLDVVQLLLKNHAQTDVKDDHGSTPLKIAQQQRHWDVARLLLANHADFTIDEVAAVGDVEKVEALLKGNHALVSSKDGNQEWTPLHTAVFNGSYGSCRIASRKRCRR